MSNIEHYLIVTLGHHHIADPNEEHVDIPASAVVYTDEDQARGHYKDEAEKALAALGGCRLVELHRVMVSEGVVESLAEANRPVKDFIMSEYALLDTPLRLLIQDGWLLLARIQASSVESAAQNLAEFYTGSAEG